MHLIDMGGRIVNLAYLIMAERIDPAADKLRVTVVSGLAFDVEGPEAARVWGELNRIASEPAIHTSTTVTRKSRDAKGTA